MLKILDIENIAVIEKAQIEFNNGLNVLTGETGAGKSIIVDSINAILGERTSRELVRHGAQYAFVSALFEQISPEAEQKLKELGYEPETDGTLLLTRKISDSGKSVCRINGSPATVSVLRELGAQLVNIHGQHDSQLLLNPDYHYNFIDMLSDKADLLDDYKNSFHNLIAVRRKLKAVTLDEDDKDRTLELLNYQINELESAEIKPGEREKLLRKKALYENREALLKALNVTLSEINGDYETSGISSVVASAEKEFEAAVAAIQDYLAAQNSKYSTPDLYCSLNFGFPIAYYSRISNGFGSYGTNNWRKSAHGGSDLVAPCGTEIYAAADGIVTVSHRWGGGKTGNDSYGNYVMILHGTADDGKTYATLYGHMNTSPLVSEGQAVTKGQLIGYVGTTGNSTGYHLHLELRINNVRSDPTRYIPLP